MKFDINCDLGEGEAIATTAGLMPFITSANIACGGHAGDRETMKRTVALAQEYQIHIGAHPGLPDRKNFGRIPQPITSAQLRDLLLDQVQALAEICTIAGTLLHHIKLHGALYHLTEQDEALREMFLSMVWENWPGLVIYSMAGGVVSERARRVGLASWGEGFLDRGYLNETRLVPRSAPGSLVDLATFQQRLHSISKTGTIPSPEGPLKIDARTWCIHSDTPNARQFAELAHVAFAAQPSDLV